MRVLGVDPGLTRCGVGVVDADARRGVTLVGVGVVQTAPELDPAVRLHALEGELERWAEEHRPDLVAVERVFAQANLESVMGTAQAAGVAMLVGARRGLPVRLHTPSEVKAAVTGSGRAEKAQVAAMVVRLLRLAQAPRPVDATDALALAICASWRSGSAPVVADTLPGPRNRWAEAEAAHAARAPGRGSASVRALSTRRNPR